MILIFVIIFRKIASPLILFPENRSAFETERRSIYDSESLCLLFFDLNETIARDRNYQRSRILNRILKFHCLRKSDIFFVSRFKVESRR